MENIFETPKEIIGLDAIPISDVTQGLHSPIKSNLVSSTDANNLTEEQKLTIEEEITRSEEEMTSILSSKETPFEMWTYDDFDNAYNNGITFQEKQAFTLWIENRLGTSQKGFFKRYSLLRSDRQCVNWNDFDGEGTFELVMQLMRLGVLFYDSLTKEYVPKYIYGTGNLYQKNRLLINDKTMITERFGDDVYAEHQLAMSNAYLKVYDSRIKLSGEDMDKCLKFDINSDIAKDVSIREIITSSGKVQRGNFMVFVKGSGNLKEFDKGKSSSQGNRGGTENPFQSLTLREAFMWWLRNSQIKESGGQGINLYGLTWQEIYNQFMLVNNKGLGSLDGEAKFRKKEECVRVGKQLWSDFLQRGLSGQTKIEIELRWNSMYNSNPNLWDMARCSYVDGDKRSGRDYTLSSGGSVKMIQGQVPIGFTMAKRYNGDKTAYINDIRTDKRRSLSYNVLTNFQSLLAYGVGVGKTWCAIFQVAQSLELGLCKRPIFILPNQVYPQFVKEIRSILPQYKINALFNMRGDILEELKEEGGIQENSITIVTETALEMMGFSKGYKDDGFVKTAYSTLNQTLDKDLLTNEEAEKMQEAFADIVADKTKSGVDKVEIDKFKFDYVVVDEAHNYKKLVTVVKGKVILLPNIEEMTDEQLKDREKVYFKFGGGKPSSRALRLFFLTDYIQQFNKFGNTLLLTATPFTNNPLEVFSMLTYTDRNSLKKASVSASADFFQTFGDMGYNIEATISGQIKEKFTFLGWKNVPALQNLLFTNIDFIGADEIDLKRPNKIVLPFKSLLNGETNETRVLAREEQISSIITMTEEQQVLIEKLKAYANGSLEWLPDLYEVVKDREKETIYYYPYFQGEIDKIIKDKNENGIEYIAQESNWNTTDLIKDESKLKFLQQSHTIGKKRKKTIYIDGNGRNDNGDLILDKPYEPEQIAEVGSFSQGVSTKLLRSLTFQRQITISPYLFNASGYKENPTPKQYIESSAKLKYVMGCIKSVKEYHESTNTAMSGQIIYMEYGIRAFPLIADYLIEELGFAPEEVGIICGDKKMTRVMSSETSKGMPKPQHKSIVQNCFNGLVQKGNGDFDKMKDSQRCKILIGSETISEGMNLQFESSVIYQCFLPFNPTNQVQLEGRIWRQGNPYKFVRIVNPLCADSIDIFMFQKMQDKARYINQIWNRDGQTFMIDAREFDANELKEACISNPYQLAQFQTDEIKKDIQEAIAQNGYEKSKYDSIKLMLDKSVLLQWGSFPTIQGDAEAEVNQGKVGVSFSKFTNGTSSLFSLYEMLRTARPDLLEGKDLFTDAFYEYLAKMKQEVKEKYGEGNYNANWRKQKGRIIVSESDLNFTLIEILQLTRDFIKDRKISLPFGFSKEALEEIRIGDVVRFVHRGTAYQGVVDEIYEEEGSYNNDMIYGVEAEREDGKLKQFDVKIRENNIKKVVTIAKDDKKKKKNTITWGTKEFVETLPLLYQFTNGNSDYFDMWESFWDSDKSIDNLNERPFLYDYAQLFAKNQSSYQFSDMEDYNRSYKEFYDNDKKVRTLLNMNFLRSLTNQDYSRYEPTYLREVENAFSTFELQMKPQGINTISELTRKIEQFQQEVERLASEITNVGNSQAIQERAEEIIRKRAEENEIKDQSLSEGDWEQRVQDFASLNCILEMKSDTQQAKKLIIEEKVIEEIEEPKLDDVEGTDEEERVEEVSEVETKNDTDEEIRLIKKKLVSIEGLLEIFDKDSEDYKLVEKKIDALNFTLSIYE